MKYFFFDIDGTLTSSKVFSKIPESTIRAIENLKKSEHFVALATGRAQFLADEFAQRIKINNYVCEGGNCLVKDGEQIYFEYPNVDEMKLMIRQCEMLNIPYAINIDNDRSAYSKYENFLGMIGRDVVILNDVRYAPDMDFENQKVRRLFLLNKDRDKIAKLEGLKELCLMGYEWSPFRLVEPDDKYKGIERMVKMLSGDVKDIVVFGDGINDIKMFQKAPFKIAMANACDELKELADFITHDSDEDGIEFALKHFGWIK